MIGMLSLANKEVYDKRKHNSTSLHSSLDKKLAIYRTNAELDVEFSDYSFSDLFMELLDEAIMLNDTSIMSKEQRKFVTRYFNEAEAEVVSEDLKSFDIFLSNYTGETING